ncbi:MAG: hypothetical protein C5B50_12310 [Verrucomicrobia bacterium]|nr:MAG: hypothetical protein C5B50_12310 [Verrucomicrobiota bacterium]
MSRNRINRGRAKAEPVRSADILVRSNVRAHHRLDTFEGLFHAPACCGQECPRSGTAACFFAALLTLLACQPSSLFAQGSLMPPGPPAPTMKSLDQIEARTPISAVPYTISQPGSYYLTGNLQVSSGNAIVISANSVTLDLNGFTISSIDPNNTGAGIQLGASGGIQKVTILNGFISGSVNNYGGVYSGPGFASGIFFGNAPPLDVRVSGVSISGCLLYGIYLNTESSSIVESCRVQLVGSSGIVAASVSHSTAYACGDTAILASTASDCYGYCLGNGDGLVANAANNCYGICLGSGVGLDSAMANNCYGYCTGDGSGLNATTANNCAGYSLGSGDGLDSHEANNCHGESSSGYGLVAAEANHSYGQSAGTYGLLATIATGCYGKQTGTVAGTAGLHAEEASNCRGESSVGNGLEASEAINCHGQSDSGYGMSVIVATGCYGKSADLGVVATVATGCYGKSTDQTGIVADEASNCHSEGGLHGMVATIATGCYGQSIRSTGLDAYLADTCYGRSQGDGAGIYSDNLANNCYGISWGSGTGVSLNMGVGCLGQNSAGNSMSVRLPYNMPYP